MTDPNITFNPDALEESDDDGTTRAEGLDADDKAVEK
jgi:hypothetical protein